MPLSFSGFEDKIYIIFFSTSWNTTDCPVFVVFNHFFNIWLKLMSLCRCKHGADCQKYTKIRGSLIS